MKEKVNLKIRIIVCLMVIALTVTMLPTFSLGAIAAAGEAKQIMLGTSGISDWNETDGYDYIYMGCDGTNPIKWRVLDTKTNTNADGLFVLSESLLGKGKYGDVYFDNKTYSNVYQGSVAQAWCKTFETTKLNEKELEAIISTTKSDGAFVSSTCQVPFAESKNILNGDKVFFLSAEEAENSAYGFINDLARVANYGTSNGSWWLRSPYSDFSNLAGFVYYLGSVRDDYVTFDWAARPAFNLNLQSVLFTSAAVGGKTLGAFSAPIAYTGNEWKATILDTSRSFEVTETTVSVAQGGQIEINYTGAAVGEDEYVSAMIVGENDNVLYYGQIENTVDFASGKATLTVPAELGLGKYNLKVFSEQLNGDYMTDYASAFANVELTVAEAYDITVKAGGNGKAFASVSKAIQGEKVTLTATPEEGYHFQEWQVVDSNVTVENDSFTMPDEDVTIKAVFVSHSFDKWISADDNTHTGVCECGATGNEEPHEYDGSLDEDCNICGHTRVVEIDLSGVKASAVWQGYPVSKSEITGTPNGLNGFWSWKNPDEKVNNTISRYTAVFTTDDGSAPIEVELRVDTCGCLCHNDTFIAKVLCALAHPWLRLTGLGKTCACGEQHFETSLVDVIVSIFTK